MDKIGGVTVVKYPKNRTYLKQPPETMRTSEEEGGDSGREEARLRLYFSIVFLFSLSSYFLFLFLLLGGLGEETWSPVMTSY